MAKYGQSAELILRNGNIITDFRSRGTRGDVVIASERIVEVGPDAGRDWSGEDTNIVDLDGRTVIPGLVDTHAHVCTKGANIPDVDCRDFFGQTKSLAEMLAKIEAHAALRTSGETIVALASPLQDRRMPEGRRPTKEELDSVSPDNPMYIMYGSHITVANSLALEKAGIDSSSVDPDAGEIIRDAGGEPSGELFETAQWLVREQITSSPKEFRESLRLALLECAIRGVTTIHDMVRSPLEVEAYQELALSGELPIRVQLIVRVIHGAFAESSLLDLGFRQGFGSDKLRLGGVKMAIDGGFTGGQAVFYPISDDPIESMPNPRLSQVELDAIIWRYHSRGVRICIHAIGDRGLDMVLEAFEKAVTRDGNTGLRHRIEHMGNWSVTDERARLARECGLTAVANPAFLHYLGGEAIGMLGEARLTNPLPIRSLLSAGVRVSLSADGPGYWPIDPIRDVAISVSRRRRDGASLGVDEAVSVADAFQMVTEGAAWSGFVEDRVGTVEVGRWADLAVLSGDPMEMPPEDLFDLPVDMTIVDGRIVFDREK